MEDEIMKKVLFAILITMSCMSFASCVTTVEAQDEMYSQTAVIDVNDIEMAITYGTPYAINGVVYYYIYNGLYYYPFYTRGYWYYHVYTKPLYRYPRYWRPVPRSHWFRDGRFHNPNGFIGHRNHGSIHRPHGARPGTPHMGGTSRPSTRPSIDNRRPSSTRSTVGNRNLGTRSVTPNRQSAQPRMVTPQQRPVQTQPRSTFGGARQSAPQMSRPGGSSGRFGGRR